MLEPSVLSCPELILHKEMVSRELSGWESRVLEIVWGRAKARIPASNMRRKSRRVFCNLAGVSPEISTLDSSVLVASFYTLCIFHESRDLVCFSLCPITTLSTAPAPGGTQYLLVE